MIIVEVEIEVFVAERIVRESSNSLPQVLAGSVDAELELPSSRQLKTRDHQFGVLARN